jgi:hypothetical protein
MRWSRPSALPLEPASCNAGSALATWAPAHSLGLLFMRASLAVPAPAPRARRSLSQKRLPARRRLHVLSSPSKRFRTMCGRCTTSVNMRSKHCACATFQDAPFNTVHSRATAQCQLYLTCTIPTNTHTLPTPSKQGNTRVSPTLADRCAPRPGFHKCSTPGALCLSLPPHERRVESEEWRASVT